ncbi:6989_t:CDS:2, partial [Gigaspora rosea]
FLCQPWIKQNMLNYLNDINEYVKPMRAQVLEFLTVRLEADNLKEKPCAKIHDKEFYIQCFFSEKCIQDFESEANSPITSIKGCHIIVKEFSFQFIKDSSIKSPGYDCFLNIEKFLYSTNFSDVPGLGLELKGPSEDPEIKAALTKQYRKLPFSSHPGWGGWATNYYNMEWRRVPPEQRKILDSLPGWEKWEESDKTGSEEA